MASGSLLQALWQAQSGKRASSTRSGRENGVRRGHTRGRDYPVTLETTKTRCIKCGRLVRDSYVAIELAGGGWLCGRCADSSCYPLPVISSTAKETPPRDLSHTIEGRKR